MGRKEFDKKYQKISQEMHANFPEVKNEQEVLAYMNKNWSSIISSDDERIREDIARTWADRHVEKGIDFDIKQGTWVVGKGIDFDIKQGTWVVGKDLPPSMGLDLAEELHRGQIRKRTGKSYFEEHLCKVALMVQAARGDVAMITAAVLHDALEDQPQRDPEKRILEGCGDYGQEVLALVLECTEIGPGGEEKAPWLDRKRAYLQHLSEISVGALLISVADKLQSARDDLMPSVEEQGDGAYAIFKKAGKDVSESKSNTLWFHRELVNAFRSRISDIMDVNMQGSNFLYNIARLIEQFDDVVSWLEAH
jgi:hypothetical protein